MQNNTVNSHYSETRGGGGAEDLVSVIAGVREKN